MNSLNRIKIKTPEEYEQLKQGLFNEKYHTIFIEADAHPDLILEVKHFGDSSFKEVHFVDKVGNVAALFPPSKHLVVFYTAGSGLFHGLPSNYVNYFITADAKVEITDAEIDYIVQWKDAVRLNIFDHRDVAFGLFERIDKFKELKQLKSLVLKVQQSTYKQFLVKPFLQQLESLVSASFKATALKRKEFKEFVKNQDEVTDWSVKVGHLTHWLVYTKK